MLEDWKRQLHLWRRQVVRPGTQQNMQALLVTQAGARTALGMIVVALTLLALSGPLAFWVCGLLLCLFVGPTLSAARTPGARPFV